MSAPFLNGDSLEKLVLDRKAAKWMLMAIGQGIDTFNGIMVLSSVNPEVSKRISEIAAELQIRELAGNVINDRAIVGWLSTLIQEDKRKSLSRVLFKAMNNKVLFNHVVNLLNEVQSDMHIIGACFPSDASAQGLNFPGVMLIELAAHCKSDWFYRVANDYGLGELFAGYHGVARKLSTCSYIGQELRAQASEWLAELSNKSALFPSACIESIAGQIRKKITAQE